MDKKIGILAVTFAGLFSANSYAVDIDITGLVIASPCIVNSNNPSLEVNLGNDILADSLSAVGSATIWKNFTLSLASCPTSTSSFSVAFSGTADDDTNFYKNTGGATNLKLELTNQAGDVSFKNGASLQNVVIPSTHAYDLQMRARAVSKGSVMPGSIQGQVQATFTYQ